MILLFNGATLPLAVVPVLVGPLQALVVVLPGLLVATGATLAAMFRPSFVKKALLLLWAQKLTVAVGIAAVAGLICLRAAGNGAASKAETRGASWPIWRGGPDRRGALLDADDPAHGGVVWTFADGKIRSFLSSPAAVGNRVYVTSADPIWMRGSITCLDADTGEPVWQYRKGGYRATFSSPSVSGKYLVVGEGLHVTRDARVYCIDVEASESAGSGVKLWEYRTRSHVESSPCIFGDRVAVGAGDDGVYCFELEPAANGEAKVVWHLPGEDYPDCEASPVYHDGKIYFALGADGDALVCVDAETGKELWRIGTPFPVFGSPTISKGRAYFGMGTGNYVQSVEEAAARKRNEMLKEGRSAEEIEKALDGLVPGGGVRCVDLEEHRVIWGFDAQRGVLGCVAAADDRVYFGSRDGHVYCLSAADGRLIRKWDAHEPIVASPAVGREHVYVATSGGTVYGLDARTLRPVWKVRSNSPASTSSPVVARGHVYVGTSAMGLICAGLPGREKLDPVWAGRLGGSGASGRADRSMLPVRGSFAWRYPEPGEEPGELSVTAPPAYIREDPGAAVYVGVGSGDRGGLAKLRLSEEPSKKPAQEWLAETENPVYLSAAAWRGLVWIVDGRPGDDGRKLRCLSATDGKELSSRAVARDASGELVLASGRAFVVDGPGKLSGMPALPGEALASEAWTREVGSVVGAPLPVGDILVVAVSGPPGLVALDGPTGGELWRVGLSEAPRTGPVWAGGRIWIGASAGARALDIVDGSTAERRDRGEPLEGEAAFLDCGAPAVELVTDDDVLAALTNSGAIVVADVSEPGADPKELCRIEGADAGMPPMLAGGKVFFCDEKSIQVFEVASGEKRRWLKTSWTGTFIAPMIAAGSHIYFVTNKCGLVCAKPKR